MRDTMLVFLMVIATGLAGVAVWLLVQMLRSDRYGCAALILALCFLGMGSSLLVAVGHAVGVSVPNLGW